MELENTDELPLVLPKRLAKLSPSLDSQYSLETTKLSFSKLDFVLLTSCFLEDNS